MTKLCGVYLILSRSTGKFYYGSSKDCRKRKAAHLGSLRRNQHHSIKLQRFYNKYGEDDLRFIMVKQCSREEAYEAEAVMLTENRHNIMSLNVGIDACGGDNLTNHPRRKQIIAKMRKAVIARFAAMTDEEKRDVCGRPGVLNGMFGKTHTAEARAIISKTNTGNQYLLGHKHTEETLEKYRLAAQRRVSVEGYVNPFAGRQHSNDTVKRLRKIANDRVAAGILPGNTRRVKVGRKTYASLTETSRQLGVVAATILYRIRSKNYPDYSYLD